MTLLWTTDDLIAAMGGRPFGNLPEGITGVSIDTRTLKPGEAFFAIRGDRFDGHDFATHAMAAGASVIVVSEERLPALGRLAIAKIVVPDVLRALEKQGVVPSRIVDFCQYHDVRIRLACRGKGVTFSVQSVIEKHDPRGQLRMVFATEPWERRLYINPHVEPASATAIASFMTRALSTDR